MESQLNRLIEKKKIHEKDNSVAATRGHLLSSASVHLCMCVCSHMCVCFYSSSAARTTCREVLAGLLVKIAGGGFLVPEKHPVHMISRVLCSMTSPE